MHFFFDLGSAHYAPPPDGIWYQQGTGHPSLNLNTYALGLGLRLVSRPNYAIDAELLHVGRARIDSQDVSDADYNGHTHTCLPCSPTAHFQSSGSLSLLALSFDWHITHRLSLLAGPDLQYHPTSVVATNMPGSHGGSGVFQGVGLYLSGFAGIRYRVSKHFALSYRYFKVTGDDGSACYTFAPCTQTAVPSQFSGLSLFSVEYQS